MKKLFIYITIISTPILLAALFETLQLKPFQEAFQAIAVITGVSCFWHVAATVDWSDNDDMGDY